MTDIIIIVSNNIGNAFSGFWWFSSEEESLAVSLDRSMII